MDDNPRQFIDELKVAIFRRRIGQIALAVVLAEECIRFLSAIVWYLIVPAIANIMAGQTESVLFPTQSHRSFPWIQLVGSTLEFILAVVFVFYANRWLYGRNRARPHPEGERIGLPAQEQVPEEGEDYEPIVPRMLSAPEAPKRELVPSGAVDDTSEAPGSRPQR